MVVRFMTATAVAATAFCVSAGEMNSVPSALWDHPRSGEIVAELPAVRQAVIAYLGRSGTRLIIHHAAGQEALLQAEELRAWLVALAVSSERVGLKSDLTRGETLKIEVMP